jgi:hypothetical protein
MMQNVILNPHGCFTYVLVKLKVSVSNMPMFFWTNVSSFSCPKFHYLVASILYNSCKLSPRLSTHTAGYFPQTVTASCNCVTQLLQASSCSMHSSYRITLNETEGSRSCCMGLPVWWNLYRGITMSLYSQSWVGQWEWWTAARRTSVNMCDQL